MLNPELLAILCCPETHQSLSAATPTTIDDLNKKIASGNLKNRAGHSVTELVEGGLIREDGKHLYFIRNGIPVMLIDEAIPLCEMSTL